MQVLNVFVSTQLLQASHQFSSVSLLNHQTSHQSRFPCNAVFLITGHSEWSCCSLCFFLLCSSRAVLDSALHHRIFYELSQSPASNHKFWARRSSAHSSWNRAPIVPLRSSIATQLCRLSSRTGLPRISPSTRSVFLGMLFFFFFLLYPNYSNIFSQRTDVMSVLVQSNEPTKSLGREDIQEQPRDSSSHDASSPDNGDLESGDIDVEKIERIYRYAVAPIQILS